MSRLNIPSHPHRVFKDDTWEPTHPSAFGWRSLGDHGDVPARYGELWAFAVEDDADGDEAQRRMYDRIVNLEAPFLAAEIVKLGSGLVAIGFYPEPPEQHYVTAS